MAEARTCDSCDAWLCKAEDARCGYCGEPCGRLEFTVKPSILVLGEISPRLGIRLKNPTLSPLRIESVQAPSWISVEPCVGRTVAPGEDCFFWSEAATYPMKEPQGGEITLATTLGKVVHPVSVIAEDPEIVCTPQQIEAWTLAGESSQKVVMEFAPRAGELTIVEVKTGGSAGLEVVTALKEPFRASPRNRLSLAINARGELLVKKSYANLRVGFDGPHGRAEKEVTINLAARNAPRLTWVGQYEREEPKLTQSAGQLLSFVLSNKQKDDPESGRGNAKLIVESVTLTPPPECTEAIIRSLTPMPVEIEGGKEGTVQFELNLERMHLAKPDLFYFSLDIKANIRVNLPPVSVQIRPVEPFEGMLAIDFGSSNTACAAVMTGGDCEPINLEKDQAVSPTYIRYINLSGAGPEVRIGEQVKRESAVDERVAASTLSDLKQKLGDPDVEVSVHPARSDRRVMRKVTLAVADYLQQVRRVAEIQKKASFREFIVTHPAVCSLKQFRNLNDAIQQSFGGGPIHLLQEPIAAVLPFIVHLASSPDTSGNDFTVASFDLGGGTTDIAVLIVHREWLESGRMEIRPRIEASRGVRFGGEDLTRFLEDKMLASCERILAGRNAGLRIVRRGMSGVGQDAVDGNQYELRRAAEELKESLSERPKTTSQQTLNLRVWNQANNSVQFEPFRLDEVLTARGSDIRIEFNEFAQAEILKLAGLLGQCAARVQNLDYIHLSGMTTFLPVVKKTIQEVFPRAKIERDGDPKECVVAGACLSVSMLHTKRRLVLPPGAQRTTSSIGVFDVDAREFTPILAVNQEIPEEGLAGVLAGYWSGSERIVLWENLGLDDKDVQSSFEEGLLTRLGTWLPSRTVAVPSGQEWALQLLLKDFQVLVSAVGPHGDAVAFRQADGIVHPE